MKQLQLRNGDLVLGPGGFATVSGAYKVRQDLGAAVREVIGTDRFHPRWGTVLHDYTGVMMDDEVVMLVKGEIARVINNYIVAQSEQVARDMDAGRRSLFTPDEIVSSIASIETQARADRLNVRVTVSLASGGTLAIVRSVEVD